MKGGKILFLSMKWLGHNMRAIAECRYRMRSWRGRGHWCSSLRGGLSGSVPLCKINCGRRARLSKCRGFCRNGGMIKLPLSSWRRCRLGGDCLGRLWFEIRTRTRRCWNDYCAAHDEIMRRCDDGMSYATVGLSPIRYT